MAQAQTRELLLGNLVESVIEGSDSKNSSKSLISKCEKIISQTDSPRTNQFAVNDKATGLIEKFKVLNRDDLSKSLEAQFTLLNNKKWKWSPETLSLFFLLSNRPLDHARKSGISFEHVVTPSEVSDNDVESDHDSSTSEDSELWRNTNFAAADSSDEDWASEPSQVEKADSPLAACFSDNSAIADELNASSQQPSDLPSHLQKPYWKALSAVASTKSGFEQDDVFLTEAQMIREVIHMLLGLSTSIFTHTSSGMIEANEAFSLVHTSSEAQSAILRKYCQLGQGLHTITVFIAHEETDSVVQRCQHLLQNEIANFEALLHDAQSEYLNESSDCVVSLTDLHETTTDATSAIRHVTPIIEHMKMLQHVEKPTYILDGLFGLTCRAQSLGHVEMYRFAAKLFLSAFDVYRRMLHSWMTIGKLQPAGSIHFIQRNDKPIAPEDTWKGQFSLHKNINGLKTVPGFLESSLPDIFSAGKSSHLLGMLKLDHRPNTSDFQFEDDLTYEAVCEQTEATMLSPFASLFESKLRAWVDARLFYTANILRNHLEKNQDFAKSLDALQLVFLHQNGVLASSFLIPVYDRLDSGHTTWNDPFMLRDILRSSFALDTDSYRLSISLDPTPLNNERNVRSMTSLETIKIVYRLPWLVANVVQPSAIQIYQKVFNLGAQLHRAKWLLQRNKIHLVQNVHRKRLIAIRAQLLHFTYVMTTHLLILVIEPHTRTMRQRLAKTANLDEMIAIHQSYMQQLESECLLSSEHASLKQAIISILDLTILLLDLMWLNVGEKARTEKHSDDDFASEPASEEDSRDASGKQYLRRSPALSDQDIKSKLDNIVSTYSRLHEYILASVQNLSKEHNSPCWDILANNLAAGNATEYG